MVRFTLAALLAATTLVTPALAARHHAVGLREGRSLYRVQPAPTVLPFGAGEAYAPAPAPAASGSYGAVLDGRNPASNAIP